MVFACPADTALALLGEEASAEERDVLGRFTFSENTIYVHRWEERKREIAAAGAAAAAAAAAAMFFLPWFGVTSCFENLFFFACLCPSRTRQRRAADAKEAGGVERLELPRQIRGDCGRDLEGTSRGGQARVRHLLAQRGEPAGRGSPL